MRKSLRTNRHRALCRILADERKKARLNQTALARRLDRHQSYISKTETGERRLDLVEFIDLCDALKIDPVKILKAVRKEPR